MVALPAGPTREVPVQPTPSRGTTYEGASYRATTTYEVDEATIEEPAEEDVVSHARPYAGNGRVSDAGPVVAQAVVGQPMVVTPEPDVSTIPERVKPRHARREVIEAPASAGPDGLPRRVRQSSLAPQLRDTPPENTVSDNASTRSPEQLRAMMSAFQSGMNRGRQDADDSYGEGNDSNAERDSL
jgi:hypothetical protein